VSKTQFAIFIKPSTLRRGSGNLGTGVVQANL